MVFAYLEMMTMRWTHTDSQTKNGEKKYSVTHKAVLLPILIEVTGRFPKMTKVKLLNTWTSWGAQALTLRSNALSGNLTGSNHGTALELKIHIRDSELKKLE